VGANSALLRDAPSLPVGEELRRVPWAFLFDVESSLNVSRNNDGRRSFDPSPKLDSWATVLPAKYEDHTGEDGRHEHNSGAHGLVNPRPEQPGKDKHSSDPEAPSFCRFNKRHFTRLHRKPCQGRRIIPYSLKREIESNRVSETENMLTVTRLMDLRGTREAAPTRANPTLS
jgi:hypothetical protein